ncbi:hypothetical protein ACFE04_010825 [Oxalis oulophora]
MGLQRYGKGDWKSISRNAVVSRTPTQVASHAQKYFLHLNSIKKDKKRSSIHDITIAHHDDHASNSDSIEAALEDPTTYFTAYNHHHQAFGYGKGYWKSISRNAVVSRTPTQVASHAQKYFLRLNSIKKDKKRSSIHDITTAHHDDHASNSDSIEGALEDPTSYFTAYNHHHQAFGYGKGDWRSISRNAVVSRTPTQVKSHAQKYFLRLNSIKKDKKRSSIHDITIAHHDDHASNSDSIEAALEDPTTYFTAYNHHHQAFGFA